MCGIAGLFSKSPEVSESLGHHLGDMLLQLGDRGPDSAGVAIYRNPAPSGSCKVTLHSPTQGYDWNGVQVALAEAFGAEDAEVRASHAVVVVDTDADSAVAWLRERYPELRVMSAGEAIEIYKEAGHPADFLERFSFSEPRARGRGRPGPERSPSGTHALGHTRMATESKVTTDGSHPFSTGLDLCLVHNGSLSNHNRLRERLRAEGIEFQTENDSEVAAGYLTWRMREGASLEQALEGCLADLDGFYTFAVGTVDGFAVLRDPIACKPAVMAETEGWVAMASEYRAIATLPGADEARMWEPEPGQVYSWERTPVL
jgi:methylamine---glutamate N-methyltransferase subunit A